MSPGSPLQELLANHASLSEMSGRKSTPLLKKTNHLVEGEGIGHARMSQWAELQSIRWETASETKSQETAEGFLRPQGFLSNNRMEQARLKVSQSSLLILWVNNYLQDG